MRTVFVLMCTFLFLSSCKTQKATISLEDKFAILDGYFTVEAEVVRIDSTEHFHFIFIEGNQKYLKIVSDIIPPADYITTTLEVGNKYTFKVKQITKRTGKMIVNGKTYFNASYLHIQASDHFEKAEVCTEFSYELTIASNVDGLYITN